MGSKSTYKVIFPPILDLLQMLLLDTGKCAVFYKNQGIKLYLKENILEKKKIIIFW